MPIGGCGEAALKIERHEALLGACRAVALLEVPVCRSEASKVRHGGLDLRRDAAAAGEAVM